MRSSSKESNQRREIIRSLIELYDVKSTQDIHEALKDLLGGTIQEMLESEFEEHLGYIKNEKTEEPKSNYRNGHKPKRIKTSEGEIEISVPQDRNSDFEPQIVPKYKRDISEIERKIIAMYGRGQTTREISSQIEEIYGFNVSAELVSKITDKLIPYIEEWQNRPLSFVYPIVFIDAVMFSVRRDKNVQKMSAYIVLGVTSEGMKEVLSIELGETESAKYWLNVFNSLKHRGVKDILVLCADGLSGIKEAIETAFPQAEYQRCIVHMIRNTLKHVSYKDMKEFAADLKRIYHASNEEAGYANMVEVSKKWCKRYPQSMKRWEDNWSSISPIFKYSQPVRESLYTTNAIESLNSQYRRINRSRSVFPSEESLKKALYLATINITKKWTAKIRNWGQIIGELSVMFPERINFTGV
jgi:transposase-like protein